jgi:hypothetical protein
MTVPASIGDPVVLVIVLEDGNESMYPQAEVYAADGTSPIATVSLPHKVKGRYEATWTPLATGAYSVLFITYVDVGHSVESLLYTREAEQIFVTQSHIDDLAAKLARVLGLTHENAFIDNTAFDINGQMTAGRIRIFDSRANAQAATDGGSETAGLIATYTIEATYEAIGRMRQYRMVRE